MSKKISFFFFKKLSYDQKSEKLNNQLPNSSFLKNPTLIQKENSIPEKIPPQ